MTACLKLMLNLILLRLIQSSDILYHSQKGRPVKLKLEQSNDITILSVSDGIEAAQIPVLKAGLHKLFQSKKTLVVLDLLTVKNELLMIQPMLSELSGLPHWAQEQGAQLAVISTATGVGTANTREEGIRAIQSPLAGLQMLEAKLQAQLKMLETQKADFTQKINSAAADDVRALRQENSKLHNTIKSLEEINLRFLKKRTEPSQSIAVKAKWDELQSILSIVLVQEGLLADKDSK